MEQDADSVPRGGRQQSNHVKSRLRNNMHENRGDLLHVLVERSRPVREGHKPNGGRERSGEVDCAAMVVPTATVVERCLTMTVVGTLEPLTVYRSTEAGLEAVSKLYVSRSADFHGHGGSRELRRSFTRFNFLWSRRTGTDTGTFS